MAKVHVETTQDDGEKPLRKVPDICGSSLTAIKDRIDFWYNQGQYAYFQSRVDRVNSTVLRMNMVPGPFVADPKVVALCDAVSFRTLFDPSKVDKTNSLTGAFMPSVGFTGGYRVCADLDPSEANHTKIKQAFFNAQATRKQIFIPTFISIYNSLFDKMEASLAKDNKCGFTNLNEAAAFEFVGVALLGTKPTDEIRSAALKYIFFQFHPIMTVGLPKMVEEALLHTFTFPPWIASSNNKILYDYYTKAGSWILDDAERLGLSREEAAQHLIYTWIINAFLGIRMYLMRLFKWVVAAGPKLHQKLATEIRSVVNKEGINGEVTFAMLDKMELTKSVVYEAFRMDPPVPAQYAWARKDLIVESHDAKFEVKKGEMLCGFQPLATRDPRVFEKAEEFVAERFMGEEGNKLLKYVVWSNGAEDEKSKVDNKMCAGKEMGPLVGRLLLTLIFQRYDEIVGEVGKTMEDTETTVTGLVKASGGVV